MFIGGALLWLFVACFLVPFKRYLVVHHLKNPPAVPLWKSFELSFLGSGAPCFAMSVFEMFFEMVNLRLYDKLVYVLPLVHSISPYYHPFMNFFAFCELGILISIFDMLVLPRRGGPEFSWNLFSLVVGGNFVSLLAMGLCLYPLTGSPFIFRSSIIVD